MVYGITCKWKSIQMSPRLINFNVTEYKKFIDKVSDSTLQLIFKKLPSWFLVQCQKCSQLSEKAIKILIPFPTECPYEVGFSLYALIRQHIATH